MYFLLRLSALRGTMALYVILSVKNGAQWNPITPLLRAGNP